MMEKRYGRGGQATSDKIIQHMCTVRRVTEGRETQKEDVKLFILYCQNFYVNAPN